MDTQAICAMFVCFGARVFTLILRRHMYSLRLSLLSRQPFRFDDRVTIPVHRDLFIPIVLPSVYGRYLVSLPLSTFVTKRINFVTGAFWFSEMH